MEPVTLELLGRQLVELRETVELQTAILMRIDGTLQGIAAEKQALMRRRRPRPRHPFARPLVTRGSFTTSA